MSSMGLESTGTDLDDHLKRIQEAFHVAGDAIQESSSRRFWNIRGFVNAYLEHRCWLVCELNAVDRGVNHCAALACHMAKDMIDNNVVINISEGYPYSCRMNGRNDVAELVQYL